MLKLGRDTGSLINHVMSGAKQPVPHVGMGGTLLMWTDREAVTVIEVFTIGKCPAVKVQRDHSLVVRGSTASEHQEYEYLPDPAGPVYTYRFRNGEWESVRFSTDTNKWRKSYGDRLTLGVRRAYRDPSF